MSSQIAATVDARAGADLSRLARVPRWFAAWERRLSRFDPTSELARLNAATAASARVSATLFQALHAAMEAARWTEGIVTPTLLEALERAGYDRTFEAVARGAASHPVQFAPARFDHHNVTLDPHHRTIQRPPGLRLDLGGTAKGWCADRAAAALGRVAPALVDAGGDIAVSGPRRDGSPWLISVANPLENGDQIALLAIDRGGVATSGRDRRYWDVAGQRRHHIIDPRTGSPAATDVLSATVVGPTACRAEVAAKMVLILGERAGLEWLESQGLAGIVVDDRGGARATRSLGPHLVT